MEKANVVRINKKIYLIINLFPSLQLVVRNLNALYNLAFVQEAHSEISVNDTFVKAFEN